MQETPVQFLGLERSTGKVIGYPIQYSWASFVAQLVKNLPANWETCICLPEFGRSLREGEGYPLQYSGLEESMDCIVHGVTESGHDWVTCIILCSILWASQVAQLVKNLPAMQEPWVWSLGWEDLLEKRNVTHSSILAWRIPWTVQSMGSQRVEQTWVTFTFI